MKNESSKPAVMVHPKALNAVRGGSVELDCTPLGVPTPESAWVKLRRNARSILLSKRKRLTLEDIQLNDEGTYACRAWNRFGNAEAYTKLTVSSEHVRLLLFFIQIDSTYFWLYMYR